MHSGAVNTTMNIFTVNPYMAERANILTAMEAWWERSDSITVLITGKTGTGESSLVNAILGKEVAKVGRSLDPETSEVTAFKNIIEGVQYTYCAMNFNVAVTFTRAYCYSASLAIGYGWNSSRHEQK